MNENATVLFQNNQPLAFPQLATCPARIAHIAAGDQNHELSGFHTPDNLTLGRAQVGMVEDSQQFDPERSIAPEARYIGIVLPPHDAGRISEWYDTLSEGYEELYRQEQSEKHEAVSNLIAGRKFGTILDAGCGAGTLLERIRGSYSHAVGVDFSLGMLRKARIILKSKHTDLVRADCSFLPIRDEVVDCVLSISMLDYARATGKQLSELHRATRPGGTLIITVFHPEADVPPVPTHLGFVERHEKLSKRERLYLIRNTEFRNQEDAV